MRPESRKVSALVAHQPCLVARPVTGSDCVALILFLPPLPDADSAWDLSADRRYAGIDIPQTESLKDTIDRVLPYWESRIAPDLKAGKRVLISAHGNSLRALVKHLSDIPDDEITGLEIPTGQPIVYELADDLTPTDRYYLNER